MLFLLTHFHIFDAVPACAIPHALCAHILVAIVAGILCRRYLATHLTCRQEHWAPPVPLCLSASAANPSSGLLLLLPLFLPKGLLLPLFLPTGLLLLFLLAPCSGLLLLLPLFLPAGFPLFLPTGLLLLFLLSLCSGLLLLLPLFLPKGLLLPLFLPTGLLLLFLLAPC